LLLFQQKKFWENLGIFWSVNLTDLTKILEKITKKFMSENWRGKTPILYELLFLILIFIF
jgi:hypothetical protein